MELLFFPHAIERMFERKITVTEVQNIIESYDGRIQQTRDKVIFYKRLPKRKDNLVAAVAVQQIPGDKVEVITVLVHFEVKI
jgi:hypothetical protein